MRMHTTKSGMTLVEVLVFMTLALSLMGGMFPMIYQARRMDAASEERFSAFFTCHSTLEELRLMPFEELTKYDGFEKKNNGEWYQRTRNNVTFHTKGGYKPHSMEASEIVKLTPGNTGDSPHVYASVTLRWDSGSFISDNQVEETVSIILYDKG